MAPKASDSGVLPGGGEVSIEWDREGDEIQVRLRCPADVEKIVLRRKDGAKAELTVPDMSPD